MATTTNLKKVKEMTKLIARAVPVKYEGDIPIAIHPFTTSTIWFDRMLQDKSDNHSKYDLSIPEVYDKWCEEFDEVVDRCESLVQIYMLWRDPWKLTFMKFCGPHLGQKDYAEYLADAWVTEENPNMDSNVSISESIRMFMCCKKEFLMVEKDLEYYNNLPAEVVLYRGVSKGRIKLGLSWTDDKEMAEWFMNRWVDEDNCLLKVTAKKEDIVAYFNTRNERECLLNVLKYKNKIEVVK